MKVLFKIAKTCKPETIKLLFPDTRSDLVLVGLRTMKSNVYNYNYENCYLWHRKKMENGNRII